jgi:hypothetical protein
MDHFLSNSQFGFRKNLSTINATYKLINDMLMALINKRKSGGIFFDLEKAFTCVNHHILLAKMEYYGVNGVIHSLIKSYLENNTKGLNLTISCLIGAVVMYCQW